MASTDQSGLTGRTSELGIHYHNGSAFKDAECRCSLVPVCRKCGRQLTGRRSNGRYGWRCQARISRATRALRQSRHPVAIKAAELLEDGAIVRVRPRVFRCVSSDGLRRYWVAPEACTCIGGMHDKMCYHRVAATILAEG